MPTKQAIALVLVLGVALPAQGTHALVRDVALEGAWKSEDEAGVAARRECLSQVLAARHRVTAATEVPRSQWLRRLLLASAADLVEGPVNVEDLKVNRRKLVRLRGEVDPARLDLCWAQAGEFHDHLGSPTLLFDVRSAAVPVERGGAQPMLGDCQALFAVRERLQKVGFTVVDLEVASRLRRELFECEKLEAGDVEFLKAIAERRLAGIVLRCGGATEGPQHGHVRGAPTTTYSASLRLEAIGSDSGRSFGSGHATGKGGDREAALVAASNPACELLLDALFVHWNREAFAGRKLAVHVDLPAGAASGRSVVVAMAAVAAGSSTSPQQDRQGIEAVVTTMMPTSEYGRLLAVELAKKGLRSEVEQASWSSLRLRLLD